MPPTGEDDLNTSARQGAERRWSRFSRPDVRSGSLADIGARECDVRYRSLADIAAALPDVCFTPRKQTSPRVLGMSAKCQ
jgi:hypothetical protein